MTATLIASKLFKARRLRIVENNDHSKLLLKISESRCKDSFGELFNYYSNKLYHYGICNQLNETQAGDLVQEVMTRVWLKASLFDIQKGEASTWIYTLARNIRFDILRKNIRESNVITSEEIWRPIPTHQIDQDADLEHIQENKELRELVNQLPDKQKDVITQVYFGGQTQEEYAQTKKLPLGTVKSRIRLGIRKLNNLLEMK
jgi:RNA polymerase sigma-70 factor (ECF subfamily)